jgi:IS30 family transposase
MVNEVKMGVRDAILGLVKQGWSRRRIARELGVHRRTVARYIALAEKESNCPAIPICLTERHI